MYIDAGSIGNYLGLSPVRSLHMPVPLNILLIGFNGDGEAGVELAPEELQAWFEQLDHVLPHTRVPLVSLTCQEDGAQTVWNNTIFVGGRFYS